MMANSLSFYNSQSRDLRVRALTAIGQDGVVTRHRAEVRHQACPGPSPPSQASPWSGPTGGPWSRPGSRRTLKTSTDLSSQWAMEIFETKINKVCISSRIVYLLQKMALWDLERRGEMIARMGGGDPTRGSLCWPLLASGRRVRNGERGRGRLRDYTELSPTRRGLRVSDAMWDEIQTRQHWCSERWERLGENTSSTQQMMQQTH